MNSDRTLQVFRLVSIYLPSQDSLQLLCLNTYFHINLPNSLFKRYIVERALPLIFCNSNEQETIDNILHNLGFADKSYDCIYDSIKSASNLVKNPYGARGFKHWSIKNSGAIWAIENWGTYNDKSSVFVSSFGRAELFQRVKLPRSPNRFLVAKSLVAKKWNCKGKAQMMIKLDNGVKYRSEELVYGFDSRYKGDEFSDEWVSLSVRFRVPDEVRSVKMSLIGVDTRYRDGNRGARFGMNSIRIFRANLGQENNEEGFRRRMILKLGKCCTIL